MRDTSRYVIDGTRWPSVTECLKIAGWIRFDGVDPRILEAACARGTWVHEATVLMDESDLHWPSVPQQFIPYLRAYEKFRNDVPLTIVKREEPLRCDPFRYVGTPDLECVTDGRDEVDTIDLKTSEQPAPWWALQTYGYHFARGNKGRRFSLRLKPDGNYKLDRHDDRADRDLFLAAVTTAHGQLVRGAAKLEDDDQMEQL